MDASALEVVEAPGGIVPFSLKPILVDMEGGCYMGPILPGPLEDLLVGRQAIGSSSSSGGISGGSCGLVPAQDVHFFYTGSHLSVLQNYTLLFSTNFQFIFIYKKCITQFSH